MESEPKEAVTRIDENRTSPYLQSTALNLKAPHHRFVFWKT